MTTELFTNYLATAAGAVTGITVPNRLSMIVNALDYGADPTGNTDSTTALQAACDAAFGPFASPNGGSASGYVKNITLFIPNGTYNISSPLFFTVLGARITGAGKMATRIVQTATSGSAGYGCVFITNGFSYSTIENLTLVAAAPGGSTSNAGFWCGWDGSVNTGAAQCIFRNVRFENGDYGIGLGGPYPVGGSVSNAQGSEYSFVGCDFVDCANGAQGFSYNALDYTMLGCSFSGCGIGINENLTSPITPIMGCNFSGSTSYDVNATGAGSTVMEGCISTSTVFTYGGGGGQCVKTKSCTFAPGSSGHYCNEYQNYMILDGCIVTNAILEANGPGGTQYPIYMRGNTLPANFISGISSNPPSVAENI